MTRRFLEAVQGGGSIEDLVAGLSPDVVLITDGGGLKQAALRPIRGVDNVMRFYAGVITKSDAPTQWREVDVNGQAGMGAFHADGTLDLVAVLDLDGPLVREIYMIRNPEKLRLLHP